MKTYVFHPLSGWSPLAQIACIENLLTRIVGLAVREAQLRTLLPFDAIEQTLIAVVVIVRARAFFASRAFLDFPSSKVGVRVLVVRARAPAVCGTGGHDDPRYETCNQSRSRA